MAYHASEKAPGQHLTVFVRCRGGTIVEVDVSDLQVEVREHAAPPAERMPVLAYMEKTWDAAIQQNLTDRVENLFPEITKGIRRYNKKEKQKRRKKMKRLRRSAQ